MKKFKDLIYDYNDILIAILIVIIASAVIFWKVTDVMAYPSFIRSSQKTQQSSVDMSDVDLTQTEVEPIAEPGDEVTTGEGETQTPTEDLTQTPYVGTDKEFEIKSGEYLSTVANNLLSQGLIADKNEFIKTVESMGLANKVQVGKFTIPGGATYEEIAKIITKTR